MNKGGPRQDPAVHSISQACMRGLVTQRAILSPIHQQLANQSHVMLFMTIVLKREDQKGQVFSVDHRRQSSLRDGGMQVPLVV